MTKTTEKKGQPQGNPPLTAQPPKVVPVVGASAAEEPANALEQLAAAVGPAPAHVLDAWLAGTSPNELVDEGRRIASSRIITDCSRLYWQAHNWYQQANSVQRKIVRGFTPPLFAIAVHEALGLKVMNQGHTDQTAENASTQKVAQTVATQAAAGTTDLRDQAAQVLTQVAGSEAPYAAQAAQAIGTVKTADDRVRSLKNLATTLAGWLALDPSAPIHVRATSAGLDAEYVAELKEAAQKVKTAAAGAEKRGGGKSVTQGELDRKDGVNLLLLDAIIAAFDGANQRDASIPRLIPIATRSYFGRRVKKQPPSAATATTPAATPIK